MKKKLYLLLVVVTLIITMTGCSMFGDTTVSLEGTTALAGDNVKVPLSIKNNPGLFGGQVIINYDKDVFEFVSCTSGDVFDRCDSNDEIGMLCLLVNSSEPKDVNVDGLVATLNFKIKDLAKDGDYKIVFDEETNFCNIDAELQEVVFVNATVTVK